MKWIASVLLALAFVTSATGAAAGGGKGGKASKSGYVNGTLLLDGFESPPGADRGARGYVNPCTREGFSVHVSERTSLVMSETEKVAVEFGGDVLKVETSSLPGSSLGFSLTTDESFRVEFVQWRTACASDVGVGVAGFEPGSLRRFWVKNPTHGAVVPALLARVYADLVPPTVSWLNEDPEFGWIYVNVANDFRIDAVEPVRYSVTVSNVLGSVSGWAEAVPSLVLFDAGEPGAVRVGCSYEQALEPYVVERPGACSYRYRNSSAVVSHREDEAFFVGRMTLVWDVSASGGVTVADGEAWRQEPIAVAEIQAIEVLIR